MYLSSYLFYNIILIKKIQGTLKCQMYAVAFVPTNCLLELYFDIFNSVFNKGHIDHTNVTLLFFSAHSLANNVNVIFGIHNWIIIKYA